VANLAFVGHAELRLARRSSIRLDKQLNCHKVSLQRSIDFGVSKKTRVSWASLLLGGPQPYHIWIAAGNGNNDQQLDQSKTGVPMPIAGLAAICYHGAILSFPALSGLTPINLR
jgi:hypothetical protein